MLVAEAFVSGSLGQAIFWLDNVARVIDSPEGEAREALPNEIYWFRHSAREIAPAHADGLPVSIEVLRKRLHEERRFFMGLDGLLIGMDPDFPSRLRRNGIRRAEDVLSVDDDNFRRVRQRILIPANAREWDPKGGFEFAQLDGAKSAGHCYLALANGVIDRLANDIADIVVEKVGNSFVGAQRRDAILRSGILSEFAFAEARADVAHLATLVFRRSEFPKLQAADPSGQILTALIRRIEQRISTLSSRPPEDSSSASNQTADLLDPILAAVDQALPILKKNSARQVRGGFEDLPSIQRELAWIAERLRGGQVSRAEQALIKLIARQTQRSRARDLIKTLTSIADVARAEQMFELTWRLLSAVDMLGVADAPAQTVRAQTLRSIGRYEDALAILENVVQGFPQDEVAPTVFAETLRDLGRSEEALASLQKTIVRFPHNRVTRNAYAETLRDLGRYEEALAIFEEMIRKDRKDQVTWNAYAETLRDIGRYEEALLTLEECLRTNGGDDVSKNIFAATLRDLGRYDEALVVLEEAMRKTPDDAWTRNAYAATLRDVGRYDEALSALEYAMRKFPNSRVARTIYCHVLIDLGRLDEAESVIAPGAERLITRSDWVDAHVIAMLRLRVGRTAESISALEHGMRHCPFPDQAQYFSNSLPVALLANEQADEAMLHLEQIAKSRLLPAEANNVMLFQAHALALTGDDQQASTLLRGAQIIDLSSVRQKRLASAISERFGLNGGIPPSSDRVQQLNKDIATLEFELVRPKLQVFRASTLRAA